jgi:hypothetical protein
MWCHFEVAACVYIFKSFLNLIVGGLDSRGKKKKAIPNPQMKTLLEEIENGEVDERDPFPIPDPFWPSQVTI